MTTVFFTFGFSLVICLVLTPIAKRLCTRYGIVDNPSERKVHTCAIARCGGAAIFISFFVALCVSAWLQPLTSDLLVWNEKRFCGLLGALVAFGVGLFDDVHRLGPRVKFPVQILAASLAYYGGLRIEAFSLGLGGMGIEFGFLSYFITVFWFLLFINAVNLIDGLDGLAAGVAFFACLVMIVLSVTRGDYLVAVEFAALGGALLGFLRYNFNPASIFMGDGGSYFIGYTIAALAILSSSKSEVGASLMIPLLALGVPIFDTLLSPLRRWVRGRRMFHPDKGHIHHQLLRMGFSSKKTVMIIYTTTAALCVASIMIVHSRNAVTGLILAGVGAAAVLLIRRRGYLEYMAVEKVFGWLQDISDATGISRDRRSFLSLQIEIGQSEDLEDLWRITCQALERLSFDRGEIHIPRENEVAGGAQVAPRKQPEQEPQPERRKGGKGATRSSSRTFRLKTQENGSDVWVWTRGHYRRAADIDSEHFLKVDLPLCNGEGTIFGRLLLVKDIRREPLPPYVLTRVEHLRRSVTGAMKRMNGVRRTMGSGL